MKRTTVDGTPDPGPFRVTLEAEHPIEIVTEFPKLRFCARIEGQEHTSTFPDQGDEWWVAHWRDFIAVVAKATGRTLHGVEGEDQWWVLDVPLSGFKDYLHRDQPRFSIKLLKEMPAGWDSIEKYLHWHCDNDGWRNGMGYYPEVGADSRGWESIHGISADPAFDLYSSVGFALENAKKDGFKPKGKWVGRIITGPLNGQFRMELKIPTGFKYPEIPKIEWD